MWSPASTTTVSDGSCSMTFMFRSTASAVPRYHSATRPRETYGCSSFTPPWFRSRSHGRPSPMWSLSERGLYCVNTTTSWRSEFTQLDSVKSMMRYLPPNGTAGLAGSSDRIDRGPAPPPRGRSALGRFRPTVRRPGSRGSCRAMLARASARTRPRSSQRCVNASPQRRRLEEQPRVHEIVVEFHHPVEMRAGRMTGGALGPDDRAFLDRLAGLVRATGLHVGVPGLEVTGVGDDDDPRG